MSELAKIGATLRHIADWKWAHPEMAWLFLALAGVVALVVWARCSRRRKVELFVAQPLLSRLCPEAAGEGASAVRERWSWFFMLAGSCLAVVALMWPMYGQRQEQVENFGQDIFFVVDVSQSMNADDYKPTRLEALRLELSDLIRRLAGNRLGLIGFAGMPVILSPLTADSGASQLFLDGLDSHSVPVPGTVVGDAVRLAIERFSPEGGYIVLLTDGEDHHSDPLEAAKEAAKRNVHILAVGIGTSQGATVPNVLGSGGLVHDASGQQVVSHLDEDTLKKMASLTDGAYIRLKPGMPCAAKLADIIKNDTAKSLGKRLEKRMQPQYYWPLGLAVLCLILAKMPWGRRHQELVAAKEGGRS